jgi:4,5-DOPA dioxygenase extradiol
MLERMQGAQRVAAIAVEREDGVDDVLEHAGSGERALLGDVTQPNEVPALRNHGDYARSAPTPDHFIPLLYIAGLAGAANRRLELLIDGHAYGSISMAAYTLDAKCPTEFGDKGPSAALPDPSVVPPLNTNM